MTGLSLRLALLYGVLFFGPGVAMPFLPVFLATRGLDAEGVALALGVAQAARLLAGPAGGRLADHFGDRRAVIIGAALISATGALLLPPAHGFVLIVLALMVHGAGAAPLVPLIDTVALAERVNFGRVRALGSVTFIGGTFLGAWALGALGPGSVPWIIGLSMLATAAVAATLPSPRSGGVRTPGLAFALLRRPGFGLVIAASGLIHGSHAAFYALSTLHWQAAGIDAGTIGALWSIGVAAETLLLFFARPVLLRLPPLRLAAVAAAAAAIRWLGTGATVSVAPLLMFQALHALSFGATLLAAVSLVQRLVPAEMAATAQALHAALGPGLAMLLLTLASGPIYAAVGGSVFLVMAGIAAMGLGAVALLAIRLEVTKE
jgi:PPP family 3-phenylpropionic acid transporter